MHSDDPADRRISRRSVVAGALATGLLASGAEDTSARPAPGFRVSLSVSPFTEMVLQQGIRFTDSRRVAGTAEELQRLFVAHGATEVYARIGTRRKFTPGNGDHSVERGLERARLARKLGLPFNPEIGLWRSYGDITGQPAPDFTDYPKIEMPGPWHTLTVAQMTPILRDYGALIADEIQATGVKVNYWDLGNEVEFGVPGVAVNASALPGAAIGAKEYRAPDAIDPEIGKMTFFGLAMRPEKEQIAWLERHLWPHTGRLFAAVAAGIRSVDRNARFSTHLSGVAAFRPNLAVRFFQVHGDAGYLPDLPGTSFYPTGNTGQSDPLARFKETASRIHETLKRPLFVTEFAFPASTQLGLGGGTWTKPVPGYTITPEGQGAFTRDLVAWGVQTGHLAGIRPWAPDFAGPVWGAMSYFDLQDKMAAARPGLDAFVEGARRAERRPGAVHASGL